MSNVKGINIQDFKGRIDVVANSTTGTGDYAEQQRAEVSRWTMWAKVEDRSGQPFTTEGQQVWNYDTKITVRLEISRPIQSNMVVEYANGRYSIKQVVIISEGSKRFYILRCQKTDADTSTG